MRDEISRHAAVVVFCAVPLLEYPREGRDRDVRISIGSDDIGGVIGGLVNVPSPAIKYDNVCIGMRLTLAIKYDNVSSKRSSRSDRVWCFHSPS